MKNTRNLAILLSPLSSKKAAWPAFTFYLKFTLRDADIFYLLSFIL